MKKRIEKDSLGEIQIPFEKIRDRISGKTQNRLETQGNGKGQSL